MGGHRGVGGAWQLCRASKGGAVSSDKCLEILSAVGDAFNSPVDTKELLERTARAVVEQLDLKACQFCLLSQDQQLLDHIASFGLGEAFLGRGPVEAAGLAGATAVWVASLKGHGQFGGRLVEIFFGRNLRAMTIARIAIGVLAPALLLLLLAQGQFWLLVTFTLLLGASQGVITIVRGAVPLALFGTQGYGAVLGLIATPILLVNAFSPALYALIVDTVGWHNALYALLACSMLTWLAIELMSRWYEGARAERTAPAR